ncbi:hypothetical protein Dgeo_3023 (plasmid) [Deinococcus geothermalis DSM 11300]|uniref:Uncharacterized protein n=1 Tax=Deinococcus geothermalis (strain DSM 11300 / CIP 105573 / AG-3a) TaxID=319795 RepID=A8ZRF5_DEIGD|nr:hypothetical protein [Deinococcus geothermalis]ABW35064.1 hypothetical protein Dgeo_3023 [Deinococcus geothermalis DSM 11300]
MKKALLALVYTLAYSAVVATGPLLVITSPTTRPPFALALLGLLGAGAASAQSVSEHALDFGILSPFSDLIWGGLGLGANAALYFLARYLKGKGTLLKSEQLRHALEVVGHLVVAKVAEINAQAVDTLKKASADGKLTADEAGAALRTAVQEVWTALPDVLRALLTAAAGSEEAAQDAYVRPQVERQVQGAPRSLAALALPDAPPLEHIFKPSVTPAQVTAARARLGL